jgi:hypothetical protein
MSSQNNGDIQLEDLPPGGAAETPPQLSLHGASSSSELAPLDPVSPIETEPSDTVSTDGDGVSIASQAVSISGSVQVATGLLPNISAVECADMSR